MLRSVLVGLLFLFCNFELAHSSGRVDCRRYWSYGYEACGSTSYISCSYPFKCCGTYGCCYEGPDHQLYSAAEVAGLVLCTTAIATSLLLTLIICGATYCSNKEDKSHIFGFKH